MHDDLTAAAARGVRPHLRSLLQEDSISRHTGATQAPQEAWAGRDANRSSHHWPLPAGRLRSHPEGSTDLLPNACAIPREVEEVARGYWRAASQEGGLHFVQAPVASAHGLRCRRGHPCSAQTRYHLLPCSNAPSSDGLEAPEASGPNWCRWAATAAGPRRGQQSPLQPRCEQPEESGGAFHVLGCDNANARVQHEEARAELVDILLRANRVPAPVCGVALVVHGASGCLPCVAFNEEERVR
mmetsp:Transcript_32100/g.88487  ORF Transcript_32100/g.88487 Transcript_32100/m.88487 type:complete len:242 (+) Transcript_32100:579-1304(+)